MRGGGAARWWCWWSNFVSLLGYDPHSLQAISIIENIDSSHHLVYEGVCKSYQIELSKVQAISGKIIAWPISAEKDLMVVYKEGVGHQRSHWN